MTRAKIKLEPITDKSKRNQTFAKRKRGIIKKANELSTLCGVKACVVINSCDKMEPEFWPSREGAKEVHSEFKKFSEMERSKMMYTYTQESYLMERIEKEKERLMKLRAENREIELREVMFDLLKGKMMSPHHYSDPSFIGELNLFIGRYVNHLTRRTQFLEARGESVPSNVARVDGSSQCMNINHLEPFQYQTPGNFYDQTQPRFYGSNEDMYTGLSHDHGQSSNQYPNSNQSYMSQLMGQSQQMSDAHNLGSVAYMDNNNSQMPVTTTTATAHLPGHSINNKRWPTRLGLD